MKLTDYKNEEALDLLADIIEPAAVIFADKEFAKVLQDDKAPKIKAVTIAIRNHKTEIIQILASIDGIPVEEYKCNVLTLPLKLIEILNDEELSNFFSSVALKTESDAYGSAMANTKANAK